MKPSTQRAKLSFYDVCINHSFNSQKLREIATASGVSFAVIEAMCNGSPVARSDAEKVLAAFSQFVQSNWTLDNVDIPLTNGKVVMGEA